MKRIIDIFRQYKEMILYLFFGGCSMIANIVTYYVCYNMLGISNVISTSIAWLVAVVIAFVTNKLWVFESKKNTLTAIISEFLSFLVCRVLTGLLDVLIMWFAVDCMNYNSMLFKAISNIIVIILNYVASKLFIFKK